MKSMVAVVPAIDRSNRVDDSPMVSSVTELVTEPDPGVTVRPVTAPFSDAAPDVFVEPVPEVEA